MAFASRMAVMGLVRVGGKVVNVIHCKGKVKSCWLAFWHYIFS